MRWTSIVAIYLLFWALSVFLVLPFGVRTHEEAGAERVPGQADSAPHCYSFGKLVLRTTIVAAVLFGLYYANYVNGWITPADMDYLGTVKD
jgi:predicted secreted protein